MQLRLFVMSISALLFIIRGCDIYSLYIPPATNKMPKEQLAEITLIPFQGTFGKNGNILTIDNVSFSVGLSNDAYDVVYLVPGKHRFQYTTAYDVKPVDSIGNLVYGSYKSKSVDKMIDAKAGRWILCSFEGCTSDLIEHKD